MGLKVHTFGTNPFPAKYDVVKSATLQFTDMLEGNNKFYQLELHQAGNDYRIYSCYGRTGTPGKKEERIPIAHIAQHEFESIRSEKIRKGYKEILVATTAMGTDAGNAIVLSDDIKKDKLTPADGKAIINIDNEISSLVKRLYDEAGAGCTSQLNGSLKASAENPLGTLTLTQINEGKKILTEVNATLSNNPNLIDSVDKEVINLTSEFYATIPQSIPIRPRDELGRERWLKQYALNNSTILDEKNDLLELLSDVQGLVTGFGSDDLATKYKELNCEFVAHHSSSSDFQRIKKFVEETQSKHHYWKLRVKNVWKVGVKAQQTGKHRDYMNKIGNVKPLFHGSRPSNILGICKKGLLLRPPGAYVTGSMFGNGLYFADQSTKSSQYATSRFGGSSAKYGNSYFMFVTDVSLGKIKEYEHAQTHLQSAPTGYNSVMGKAGSSLVHNEFIIYDLKQQELQYLVEFETL